MVSYKNVSFRKQLLRRMELEKYCHVVLPFHLDYAWDVRQSKLDIDQCRQSVFCQGELKHYLSVDKPTLDFAINTYIFNDKMSHHGLFVEWRFP